MKNKTALFHLIRAMSKSEKRYFTLDAQKSGKGNRYLELFQVINAMETYEEATLKKQFPNNLHTDKAYLYDAILRSMRDYRSANSYSARIKELIMDAKYLYERGLYEQSEERLENARELATELDDQLALLEINREARNLVWNNKTNYDDQIKKLVADKEEHLHSLSEEFKYLDAFYKLTAESRKNFDLKDKELKERFEDYFFQEQEAPKSAHARRRFYQSMAVYAQLTGDAEKMLGYYAKVVDSWDEIPKYKEEDLYRYIVDISNLLNAYSNVGQYGYLPEILQKLEATSVNKVHDKVMIFQKVSIYKLMYYINTGQSDGIESLVKAIEKGLDTYQMSLASKMVLVFNTSLLLFINEKFEDCISWALKTMKGLKTNIREDIQRSAYILYLIASYETGVEESTDSALRATQRFFNKQQLNKRGFEQSVVDYIRKMYEAPPSNVPKILRDLSNFITFLQENQKEAVSLGMDELVSFWVRSRLSKQPISKIMRAAQGTS